MPQLNGMAPALLQPLQEQLEMCLACSKCAQQENETTYRLKEVEHRCMMEILLARRKAKKPGKVWRKVGRRPSFPNPARYDVCRYYVAGLGCTKHRNRCTFAWSSEEVIVWTFERQNGLERHVLKSLLRQLQTSGFANGISKLPDGGPSEKILSEFGGHFQEICKSCFYRTPQRICARNSSPACEGHWNPLLAHVVRDGKMKEQYTEIRPCPAILKKFRYCRYVSSGRPCRHTAERCYFAHSEVEMAVWEAEQNRGLARIDLLRPLVEGKAGEESSAPVACFYCRVCLVTCDSQESFENHCSSVEHGQLVSSDTMTEWKYRAPPYDAKAFSLCSRADLCEYGQDCTKAHSVEELEEWIQRAKLAEKNKKRARQDGLVSYQDRLVAEYQESRNEVLIISEEVEGVRVTCAQPLRVRSEDKKMQHRWVFTVHSQKPLVHVALLRRVPGASFSLSLDGHSRGLTYASGKRFKTRQASPPAVEVEVCMESHTFGVYEQWLVFDFGSRPVLVRKLQARVGQKDASWHVDPAAQLGSRHLVDFERWHSGNRVVVPSVKRTGKEVELLARYKPPSLSLDFRKGGESKPITRLNYREELHNFLFREEEAQQALIARLNLQVVLGLHQMMEMPSREMKFALPGELYAQVPTPYSLTPDSKEGYLLHRSAPTAFLAPDPPTDNRVFEVSVEKKAITERSVWLLLPQRCCFELGLKANTSFKAEIQFQIDQLEFRKWHHAVDQLCDERVVLPDVAACSVPQPLGQGPLLEGGNAKQNQAIAFITGLASGIRQVPPLLIYGPFGTGKTFTLAKATLEIIKQPGSRVLICTHTNSAADIYIREYFHDYVTSGHPEAVPLRLTYTGRPPKSTDPTTLRYCCLTPGQDSFRLPTKEELDRHRVIISTSMVLPEFGLAPGYFSHILIDEAAQMLECEALVPLSLATLETRIVLAGDHMQVTPKLFCLREEEQSADHTLLTHLFQYYKKEKHEVALKSRIIFNENYRSTATIIDFVSRHFYVGKGDAIHAKGNVPAHPEIHPLMFCHVTGTAERDFSMTSWYNNLEILQVIEKIQEMVRRWPDEWGVPDRKKICVVSYGWQVPALRQELRKKHLGDVMVENFENLPGREFRIIIISTVHTRESLQLVDSSGLDFFNESRVLNTIMTRAQSLVIAVGDAVALCSFGRCSKVWKSFLKGCMEHSAVTPETLTLEEIKQAMCDRAHWNKERAEEEEEDESDTDSWVSDEESLNAEDPILLELLDESKDAVVTVSEDGLLNVKTEALTPGRSRQEYVSYSAQTMREYLRMQPSVYKRCELIKEGFDRASAFSLDDFPSLHIHIKGRVHCGTAFTGDQVLVEILQHSLSKEGNLYGKVVGVLKEVERNRVFVCTVDEYDLRVMIPVDRTVTKIFVPGLKDERNVIPVRSVDASGKFRLTMRKKLKQEDRKKYLFVVQVIKWREGFYYPLGIVTDILPVASTLEEGLRILDKEYCLAKEYPVSVNKEVSAFVAGNPPAKGQRKDFQAYLTFTVDPQGSKDLDDAISVRDLGKEYEIGIHITDLASVIPKGSALDVEAKNRGATYYAPRKEPVCMLPPQLSQDRCSLLPHKERHVISLLVLVEKKTDKMVKVSFAVSTICSDRQFTYEEAEGIIKNGYRAEGPQLRFDSLEDCVAVAYHFSRVHRMARLQEDCYYDQLDEETPLGQRCSHQMVEEFMVLFNSSVAELLTGKDRTMNLTPLRCQMEPNPQQLTHLREKYRDLIPQSTHLTHHLGPLATAALTKASSKFVLLTSSWDLLKSAASAQDVPTVLDLITTDDIHPKLAPVNLEFRKLLGRSYFLRSNSSLVSKMGHYSLHVDVYTWATSPIRRYMDVVVQRHLVSLILKEPVQYSPADIESICRDFNRKNGLANAYEKRSRSLEMAVQLKAQVRQKVAFVMNVEEMAKNFKILFPLNKETLPDLQLISYRALQLVVQPIYVREQERIRLVWKRRIYSVTTLKDCTTNLAELWDKSVTLFSVETWCKVLAAVRSQDYQEVCSLLQRAAPSTQKRSNGRMQRSRCSHYIDVTLELGAGDVLCVQLTTDLQRGFLVPFVQLWTVAPGFDVCLEHSEKPIDCFSKQATLAPKPAYRNASEYRRVWLPLSDMEAASCAVAENDAIVLHDVTIAWEKKRTSRGQLQGSFSLTKTFLKECSINLDFSYCYLCIRLSGLKVDGALDGVESLSHGLQQLSLAKPKAEDSKFSVDPDTYTWVAHGCTDQFSEDQEKAGHRGDVLQVPFYIHHMSMEKIPVEVMQRSSRFTVEVIPRQLPDVRKEKAIWRLQHATELAQAIALGHNIPEKPTKQSKLLKRRSFDLPGSLRKLNPSQNFAISEALRRPFTLIQGPPGTGKTVVGTHIVYWFHQLNQEFGGKEQKLDDATQANAHILYCGPSNKSVDVVAEMLLKLRHSLRPLRVYGEMIEAVEFPYPGSNMQISWKAQRDAKSKPEIRAITLHYRIRSPSNPFGSDICAFDAQVRRGEEMTEEEIEAYKKLLSKARKYELQHHDVILCTCSASCGSALTDTLNVKQVLVDECAMSTEPETLIPLAYYGKMEKVVLLGDHKQLRPVVHNDLCKALGMETSLFERYKDQAVMLDTQYRMHQDICRFPSEAFYNRRLKTCPDLVRRPSVFGHRDRPCCAIIFGHVEGRERSLMVSTEEGNENSRANLEEAEEAVRIAKQLTLDKTTQPEQIAILTPYNAQVVEIKKLLAQVGVQNVTVCTIMKSQGSEWKYVILSTVRSCSRSEIDQKPTLSWQKKQLGFVSDANQINVAVTRAQEGLCIIGNRYLLECNPLWRGLLQHYRNQRCSTTASAIRIRKVSAAPSMWRPALGYRMQLPRGHLGQQ